MLKIFDYAVGKHPVIVAIHRLHKRVVEIGRQNDRLPSFLDAMHFLLSVHCKHITEFEKQIPAYLPVVPVLKDHYGLIAIFDLLYDRISDRRKLRTVIRISSDITPIIFCFQALFYFKRDIVGSAPTDENLIFHLFPP